MATIKMKLLNVYVSEAPDENLATFRIANADVEFPIPLDMARDMARWVGREVELSMWPAQTEDERRQLAEMTEDIMRRSPVPLSAPGPEAA